MGLIEADYESTSGISIIADPDDSVTLLNRVNQLIVANASLNARVTQAETDISVAEADISAMSNLASTVHTHYDSGWIVPNLGSYYGLSQIGRVRYRRIDDVVYLQVYCATIDGATSGNTFFTLPSGFRPSELFRYYFGYSGIEAIEIYTSGYVTTASIDHTSPFSFDAVFVTSETEPS